MIQYIKNGWYLIKESGRVFGRHPKFLIPMVIVWCIYAPTVLYFKYAFDWNAHPTGNGQQILTPLLNFRDFPSKQSIQIDWWDHEQVFVQIWFFFLSELARVFVFFVGVGSVEIEKELISRGLGHEVGTVFEILDFGLIQPPMVWVRFNMSQRFDQ
jgi:hypothetical protein